MKTHRETNVQRDIDREQLRCPSNSLGGAHADVLLGQVRHVEGREQLGGRLVRVVSAGVQVVEGAGLLGVDELAEAVVLDGVGAEALAHGHCAAIPVACH